MGAMPTNAFDQPIGDPVPGWVPPALAGTRALVGRSVRVEPLTDEHLPGLFAATCGPDDDDRWTYMPGGPYRLITELRADLDALRRSPESAPHALVVDGRVVGTASFLRMAPAAGSIEVGYIMYGRELARTVAASEAMYLMAREAFDLGYRRYEWKCDSLNEGSRRAAARLGFRYEGRFRQALVYKGRNRDTDWFAMTDDDWDRLRPAYDRWLDGCDAQGRQRESLGELVAAALA